MKSLTLVVLVLAQVASAKTIKVAVIDTGIDPSVGHLCKSGHYDFAESDPNLKLTPHDVHGHGSHVAGLIVQNAGKSNYCLISLRYYSEDAPGSINLQRERQALEKAIALNVDVINLSGGGPQFDEQEYLLVKKALDKGIKFVVAAGNKKHDLTNDCNYYPACYDPQRLVVVGNLAFNILADPQWKELYNRIPAANRAKLEMSKRAESSNFGTPVNRWEVGTNLVSNLPGGKTGTMTGTSQATAVATGKLVKSLSQHSQ